jgi:hypothetical protein
MYLLGLSCFIGGWYATKSKGFATCAKVFYLANRFICAGYFLQAIFYDYLYPMINLTKLYNLPYKGFEVQDLFFPAFGILYI